MYKQALNWDDLNFYVVDCVAGTKIILTTLKVEKKNISNFATQS